jgi:hypothetical protein
VELFLSTELFVEKPFAEKLFAEKLFIEKLLLFALLLSELAEVFAEEEEVLLLLF